MNTWSEIKIKNSVRSKVNEFITFRGKPPTSREWDLLKLNPSRGTIRKYINMSFNGLLNDLGFKLLTPIKSPLNKNEIINAFNRFYRESNRVPSTEDLKSSRLDYMPSLSNLYKYFNSLNTALIASNLPTLERGYSESYLLQNLDRTIKTKGRLPSKKELIGPIRDHSIPEYRSFSKLGGIRKSLLKLNYPNAEINRLLNIQNISLIKEGIVTTIKNHINVYNSIPGSKEWDSYGYLPSRKHIEKLFKMSFNSLIKELNFTPKHKTPLSFTKNELIFILKDFYNINCKVPTFNDLRNLDTFPHPKIYIQAFGSFENALKAACLPSNKYLDKDFLISEIYRYIETYGMIPSTNSFRYNNDFPSLKAYTRIWGSFNNALLELGMTPVCFEIKSAFSKKCLSIDNHICNSTEECIVDNYLYSKNIVHEREVLYPYHPLYNVNHMKRCDFFIKTANGIPIYIEYAGLVTNKAYAEKLNQKQQLALILNLNLIIIYPHQLGQLDKFLLDKIPQYD